MSFVTKAGIEISESDEPPHIQFLFSSYITGFKNQPIHEERTIVDSKAMIDVKSGRALFKLNYSGTPRGKQIKAWIVVPFYRELLVCWDDGFSAVLDALAGNLNENFDGIKCGVNWDRVASWPIGAQPIAIRSQRWGIMPGLDPECPVEKITMYRKKDLSELEFEFVWKREDPVPEGTYWLILHLEGE